MPQDYVLIIDDNEDVRLILADVLEVLDLQSKSAANGKQALDLLAKSLPGLIFLDLMMPEMNGFQFISRLQSIEGGSKIPIIVFSAAADEDAMKQMPGVKAVVKKGRMNVLELRDLIKEHFQSSSSKPEAKPNETVSAEAKKTADKPVSVQTNAAEENPQAKANGARKAGAG